MGRWAQLAFMPVNDPPIPAMAQVPVKLSPSITASITSSPWGVGAVIVMFWPAMTTDEICQKIRAVTRDEVVDLAQALFRPAGTALSLLGDFKDNLKLKDFGLGR